MRIAILFVLLFSMFAPARSDIPKNQSLPGSRDLQTDKTTPKSANVDAGITAVLPSYAVILIDEPAVYSNSDVRFRKQARKLLFGCSGFQINLAKETVVIIDIKYIGYGTDIDSMDSGSILRIQPGVKLTISLSDWNAVLAIESERDGKKYITVYGKIKNDGQKEASYQIVKPKTEIKD